MTKIIIDTDPGVDDAMAIHYAFAHGGLEVLGMTSIFGNVWVEQATRNALFLAEQAHYKTAVAEGAKKPLSITPNPPSHHVHGAEGFGRMPAPKPQAVADPRPAHVFISEMCRKYPNEVVLVPVGPLTNIANLLKYDPEITQFVKRVVIMGGAVKCGGNVTPHAEANIWNDPHAADAVFAADWPVNLIGLDVTTDIRCGRADFRAIADKAPKIGNFIYDVSDFYIDFYETVIGEAVCLMHDPSAIIAITHPDLFEFEAIPLSVTTEGEMVGKINSVSARPAVHVAIKADSEKVKEVFMAVCSNSDAMVQKRKNNP